MVEAYEQATLGEFGEVRREELDRVVKNMENKNGTKEGINTSFLRMSWQTVGCYMLELVNKSLREGVFPGEWKTSTIIPIPKIANSNKVEEYRPVNMLPLYEKILETAVKEKLVRFIEQHDILINEQSGFRRGYSCETALQNTMIRWKKSLDEGKVVGVIFLDFKRAFETINREILIKKLQSYGIVETVHING